MTRTSATLLGTVATAEASRLVNVSRSFWIAFFLYTSIGGWVTSARGDVWVVAVGIRDYEKVGELDTVRSADADAREFQSFVQDRWKSQAHVTLLDGPRATKYSVENAVYLNLTAAKAKDSVYLFISARGITRPGGLGYILTHESQSHNGAGTGIPVDYFKALLQNPQQGSGGFYLFADVCRQPKDNSNWIQRSLKGLGNDNVRGILATRPDVASQDRVFTQALLGAMRETHLDLQREREFDLFFEEVKRKAGRQQEPEKLPKPPKPMSFSRPAPGFKRYPGEIALLGSPIPLLFAMQAGGSMQRLRDQFHEALTNEKLITPGGAFDLLKALRPMEQQTLAREDTILLLTELESRGQRVIADYGSGEQFPKDPMKLDAAQFLRAADYFEHAALLEQMERPDRKDEIDSRAWFCKGRAKLFDGPAQNIDGAADDFGKAVKLYPRFPEPYNGLGIVHLAKARSGRGAQPGKLPADFSAALEAFQKAIELAPLWAYSRHNLALTYTQMGDFRRAGEEYARAIQQTPFHPYLQYNLALLLQNQNRLRQAEQQYKSAVTIFQTLIDKHLAAEDSAARLGAAGGVDGGYYQAQFVREREIVDALKRNLAETYNALGTLRENRSDSAGAESYYGQALANADLLEARHNLALLWLSRRDKRGLEPADRWTQAGNLWRLNLTREPEHRPSLLGLARVYRAESKLDEAISYYQRVLKLDPEQNVAREELALSFAKAGRKDDAERELAEAIRRQRASSGSASASPAWHEELGNLYWQENRAAEACQQYCAARRAQQAGLGGAADLKAKLRNCPSGCQAK